MGHFRARLKHVGPAFIIAAVVLGPGSITLSTIAGSLYGYELVWVPAIATLFMIIYTWMSARIGLVTRQTLFQATRRKYGSTIAKAGGLFGFASIVAFQAGNNAGVGFSTDALLGVGVRFWAAAFSVIGFGLLLLPNLYRKLELIVKAMVGIMIVAFAGTLAIVGIDAGQFATGLVPQFPDPQSVFLALGMTATTFSIAAAAYQTHLMKEKNWGAEKLSVEGLDTVLGISILGGISVLVQLTSAAVIYGKSDPVFSAQTMALQLEPLAGPAAFYLFTCGFFFASLSSLIVNPLIGATLLMDGFDVDSSMDRWPVKIWALAAMAAGLGVVLIFRGSPVEVLRLAQGLSIVAFPVLGFLVLSIARDRKIMGEHANGTAMNVIAFLGYLAIIGMVINYIRQILG